MAATTTTNKLTHVTAISVHSKYQTQTKQVLESRSPTWLASPDLFGGNLSVWVQSKHLLQVIEWPPTPLLCMPCNPKDTDPKFAYTTTSTCFQGSCTNLMTTHLVIKTLQHLVMPILCNRALKQFTTPRAKHISAQLDVRITFCKLLIFNEDTIIIKELCMPLARR